MNKRIKNAIQLFFVVAIVAVLSFAFLTSCEEMTAEESARAYVNVSINPELDLIIDEDGNVESVYCVNEDAEVLLVDLDLIGMNFEDAMEEITARATELGYIDVDGEDNEVEIDIITDEENSEIAEQMQNRVRERLHKYFENNGIFGRVSQGTLDEYSEEALELGLPLGQTKMILRALEIDPSLEIEDLKNMPINEIARNMTNSVGKFGVDATQRQEFITERNTIMNEYAEGLSSLKDDIDSLTAQLEDFEGDETEKETLETALEQKESDLEALKEEMRQEIEQVANQYKDNAEATQAKRAQATQRRENNREKVRQRTENVNDERKRAVKNWIESSD